MSKEEAKQRAKEKNEAIKKLVEELAELDHQQWMNWSKDVASTGLNPMRLERWKGYWIPYSKLPERAKELDRVWANKALDIVKRYKRFL